MNLLGTSTNSSCNRTELRVFVSWVGFDVEQLMSGHDKVVNVEVLERKKKRGLLTRVVNQVKSVC